MTVINFAKNRISIVFRTPSRKFKILTIPNILALWMLYKLGYATKFDGYKVYAESRFDQFFCALSRIFEILTIPNILALGKLFKLGFANTRDGNQVCKE